MVSIGSIVSEKIGPDGIRTLRNSVKGAKMLKVEFGEVWGFMIQASFSDEKAVPPSVRTVESENHGSHIKKDKRKKSGDGVQIMRGEENTSILSLLHQIQGCGYELVDALHQVRIKHTRRSTYYLNNRDGAGTRYHAVRFVFIHKSEADISSKEFLIRRRYILDEMLVMFGSAMWSVDVFDNPCSIKGAEGYRFISINPKARQPLSYPDGSPIEIWEKDKDGNKTEEKVRLRPKFSLRLTEERFSLKDY